MVPVIVTKPFAFSELLARVQALIRRATHVTEPTRLKVGDLTLDLLNMEIEEIPFLQSGGEET